MGPLPPEQGSPGAAKPDRSSNATQSSRSNRELVADAISSVPFIGKFLARLIRDERWGLLWVSMGLLLLFVVYPLLVPILAAWLINAGLLFSAHEPYATTIQRAFRVDDAAKRGNKWLDYFQVIETLDSANQARSYVVSVEPYQRMRIRVSEANLLARSESCSPPRQFIKKGAKLFSLKVGEVPMFDVTNDGKEQMIELTHSMWEQILPRQEPGRLTIRLEPVDDLQKFDCDDLKANVRLTVEVFKDLLKPSAERTAGR